jgi:single-stranded-DNA-specific exonuclease
MLMSPRNRLVDALATISENIRHISDQDGRILIISNLSADGIAAGSIMLQTLQRLNAKCVLRTSQNPTDSPLIADTFSDQNAYHLLIDFEFESPEKLEKKFQDNWVLIQHRASSEKALSSDGLHTEKVLNINKYEIDGQIEISSGGICYLLATLIDKKNSDLSALAVLSALGDKQDRGKNRSLVGINAEIAKVGESLGLLLSHSEDLIMLGREVRPIHEAIAFNPFPYIDGLTWNAQRASSIVENSGIKSKEGGRWRVFADLSEQEKWSIYEGIAKFAATISGSQRLPIEDIRGTSYTLLEEDKGTYLRDARDYSELLRICGKMQKAGLGVSVCIGDRFKILDAAEGTVRRYVDTQRRSLGSIFGEKWRIWLDGEIVFMNGEGAVSEYLLEDIVASVESSPHFMHKIVIGRTVTQSGTYKFCCHVRDLSEYSLDLGSAVTNCLANSNGITYSNVPFVSCCEIHPSDVERFISSLKDAAVNCRNAALSH